MFGIYGLIAIVLISSLYIMYTSKDEAKVEMAGNIVKTSLGFFIGVATGFFG